MVPPLVTVLVVLLCEGIAGQQHTVDASYPGPVAVALCDCPHGKDGDRCVLMMRWGFNSSQCLQEITDSASLRTDENAVHIDLRDKSECLGSYQVIFTHGTAQNVALPGKYFKVDSGSCTGEKVSHAGITEYSSASCEDTARKERVRVTASGLCDKAEVENYEEKESRWTTRYIIILVLTPFVTALIGWGTNVIAIKMIFRPYEPRCGFSCGCCGPHPDHPGQNKCAWRGIQGVFPKRQHGLAAQIGNMVEENLLSAEEMVGKMKSELGLDTADAGADTALDGKLHEGISSAVSEMLESKAKGGNDQLFKAFFTTMGGREQFQERLVRGIVKSFKLNLGPLIDTFADSFVHHIPFKDIITDRIRNKMTPADLEEMFMSFMATELGFVEQLGGILGFIVGIIQDVIYIVSGTS